MSAILSLQQNKLVPGLFRGGIPVFVCDDGLQVFPQCEMETTNFDSTASYSTNTRLTCDAPGGTGEKQLRPKKERLETICGIVSKEIYTGEDGKPVLTFWPTWVPGVAHQDL